MSSDVSGSPDPWSVPDLPLSAPVPEHADETFAYTPWDHVLHAKADFTPAPDGTDYDAPEAYDADDSRGPHWDVLPDDNLATSVARSGHAAFPVLDLDFPAAVFPSTTRGHYHLYLGTRLSWAQYVKLLTVLGEVGILEPGYVAASLRRGYTAVRLPWIPKETPRV